MKNKKDIRDLSFDALVSHLKSMGETSFRAAQIFEWLYQKGVWSFQEMKTLPQSLRDRLSDAFILKPHTIEEKLVSEDGTTKFLFDLEDKEKIETVLIPTETRTTVCVSSQAGCKFGCKFCASGIGGWVRNLTPAEIVTQIMHVKEEALKHQKPLSHIVFMGIGAPDISYDNMEIILKFLEKFYFG